MLAKVTVIIGFVVAFGAGLAVGFKALPDHHGHLGPPPSSRPSAGPMGGWMTKELDLTPKQQEQLKKIWDQQPNPRSRGREMDDKRREFRKERDEAISALIRPEDRAKFDEINKAYSDQSAALEAEMRTGFTKAVEQSKQVLTPGQREKYEAMLKRFDAERGSRDHGRPPRDRGTTQPTTRP